MKNSSLSNIAKFESKKLRLKAAYCLLERRGDVL